MTSSIMTTMSVDRIFVLRLFIISLLSRSCFTSSTSENQLVNNNFIDHIWTPKANLGTSRPDEERESNSRVNVGKELIMRKYVDSAFDLPWIYRKGTTVVPAATSGFPKVVNVDDFGAKADGTDDTKAFKKAWKEACSSKNGILVVPKMRTYYLKPITFSGPCNSQLTMKILGTIKASNDPSDYRDPRYWILFHNVQNFNIQGSGTINGNGKIWWQNSCKVNKNLPCKDAPTSVTFKECKNLRVGGLRIADSQKFHLTFEKCVDVKAWDLVVVAPQKSPNTDGIHVSETQNIKIMSSVIKTGDDCVSIVGGSRNVQVNDINCGPGHGISIGSLGKGNSKDYVSDVFVNRVKLSGTTNGLRIKTWQGGSGYAKNIIFQNVEMHNVSNPIIIDQYYCDQKTPCPQQYSAVQVQNVLYKNIRGTSASEDAINFNCSRSFPCQGVVLQGVNLNLYRKPDEIAEASCANVWLSSRGRVTPHCSSRTI